MECRSCNNNNNLVQSRENTFSWRSVAVCNDTYVCIYIVILENMYIVGSNRVAFYLNERMN